MLNVWTPASTRAPTALPSQPSRPSPPVSALSSSHCAPLSPDMASLSGYAVRMARLSARIFGEVVRPTDPKSLKVVQLFREQPMGQRKEVYDWYPQHKIYYSMTQRLRFMGLFR